jgi:quinoprotein glucose dehydrogenase
MAKITSGVWFVLQTIAAILSFSFAVQADVPVVQPSMPVHAPLGGEGDWPYVGGNIGGQRFSPLTAISKNNVSKLKVAWTYHSGDFSTGGDPKNPNAHGASALQVTPIELDGTLYMCTPYNRIIALDAESGAQKWMFDPKVNLNGVYTPTCRGVTYYRDAQAPLGQVCRDRIFENTLDARLLSVDAHTGALCPGFGNNGFVNLLDGIGETALAEYYPTSPPLVINDVVLTGAFVKDGQRLNAPGGAVRAFDARSGELRWVFDPVPPGMAPVTAEQIKHGATLTRGTPNVWALMSADPSRNLVFLPTGNPAPDHYRGKERGEMDYYGTSIVAVDASSGAVRWHFQTVHHDVWDYDVAAQPVIYQQRRNGVEVPAVAQATKVGNLFLLNRETGAPLFPIEERPVPQSNVPGEHNSPTQPFPTKPLPVHPQTLTREQIWGLTPWDRNKCREQFDALEYRGLYTPPSLKGTLEYPGLGGGVNWGSVSIDPVKNRMIVSMQVAPFIIKLAPRPKEGEAGSGGDLVGINPQLGTPYIAQRGVYISPLKTPCVPPPWGKLVAIDLNSGEHLWERPLGNLNGLAPPVIGKMLEWGTPNSGGSIQTASGLIFIAATMDKYFRAFDADNGAELWHYELPYAGNATPMTYKSKTSGKQFVVIAAGGHGPLGTAPGDAIVAFTLAD